MEIIQGKNVTPAERLEACKMLWKELASAQKGKPRGRPFTRKASPVKSSAERIREIIGNVSE